MPALEPVLEPLQKTASNQQLLDDETADGFGEIEQQQQQQTHPPSEPVNSWKVPLTQDEFKTNQDTDPYAAQCHSLNVMPIPELTKQFSQKSLTSLVLKNRFLTSTNLLPLFSSLPSYKTIQILDLSGNSLGEGPEQGISLLGAWLAEDRHLIELNLADNKLRNRALPLIQALKDNGTLKRLDLSGNELMDREGTQLAEAIRSNQTVTHLKISRNKIGDVATQALAGLFRHTENVVDFDCSWNNITSIGMAALFNGIKENPALIRLNVEWNGIGDAASPELEQLISRNNYLKYLNIANCRITDAGFASIGQGLIANRQLEEFVLDSNLACNEAVVTMLKGAAQCDTLKQVQIRNIRMDAKSKAEAESALKDVSFKVIY